MVIPGGLVVLTDRRIARGPLVPVVRAAVRGGVAWVILRERDLPYAERAALAESLRFVVPAGRLIVAGPDPLGGDAVHLASADPPPDGDVGLIGRSCHGVSDMSDEDYVTVSPIYPTSSKPGYGPALGPRAAARIAGEVPWLALGGVDSAAKVAECRAAGANGIAVMGGIMRAVDPERVAAELASAFPKVSHDRLATVMPSLAPTHPGERNEVTRCQAGAAGYPQAVDEDRACRS